MIQLLIVDDEEIVLEMMCQIVNYKDFGVDRVHTAGSMAAAIELIEKYPIDIAFCDIEMPGGSGLDLINWINEHRPQMVKLILSAHNEFEFAQRAVRLNCFSYMLKPATPDTMADTLTGVVSEVLHRRSDTNLKTLGENYSRTISGEEEEDAIETVRKYIDQHIAEELSVEKMAEMVYISQNHLTRSFKKKYGKTVIDYIIDQRLALAEDMLRRTNKTVTMIANDVGYFDYVYFSKLFKRKYGMTPREYRMMAKK